MKYPLQTDRTTVYPTSAPSSTHVPVFSSPGQGLSIFQHLILSLFLALAPLICYQTASFPAITHLCTWVRTKMINAWVFPAFPSLQPLLPELQEPTLPYWLFWALWGRIDREGELGENKRRDLQGSWWFLRLCIERGAAIWDKRAVGSREQWIYRSCCGLPPSLFHSQEMQDLKLWQRASVYLNLCWGYSNALSLDLMGHGCANVPLYLPCSLPTWLEGPFLHLSSRIWGRFQSGRVRQALKAHSTSLLHRVWSPEKGSVAPQIPLQLKCLCEQFALSWWHSVIANTIYLPSSFKMRYLMWGCIKPIQCDRYWLKTLNEKDPVWKYVKHSRKAYYGH